MLDLFSPAAPALEDVGAEEDALAAVQEGLAAEATGGHTGDQPPSPLPESQDVITAAEREAFAQIGRDSVIQLDGIGSVLAERIHKTLGSVAIEDLLYWLLADPEKVFAIERFGETAHTAVWASSAKLAGLTVEKVRALATELPPRDLPVPSPVEEESRDSGQQDAEDSPPGEDLEASVAVSDTSTDCASSDLVDTVLDESNAAALQEAAEVLDAEVPESVINEAAGEAEVPRSVIGDARTISHQERIERLDKMMVELEEMRAIVDKAPNGRLVWAIVVLYGLYQLAHGLGFI